MTLAEETSELVSANETILPRRQKVIGTQNSEGLISADEKPSELSNYERCVYPRLNDDRSESYRLTGKNRGKPFPDNRIQTALYSPLSFFPVAFMLQLTKLALVYWFCCMLL